MAPRIRTIKPDAWQDRRLGSVSRDLRLLWTVLITMADDDGRFRALPSAIYGHGYAYDDPALSEIPGWLDALADVGLIQLYNVEGEQYGWFPRWSAHQRINRKTDSRLPAPPAHLTEDSVSDHGASAEPSRPETDGSKETETERRRTTDRAPRAASRSVVFEHLEKDPEWAAALAAGGHVACSVLMEGNPDVPWPALALEAVTAKLDTSPNSMRTKSPRTGLELRLRDHQAGKRRATAPSPAPDADLAARIASYDAATIVDDGTGVAA